MEDDDDALLEGALAPLLRVSTPLATHLATPQHEHAASAPAPEHAPSTCAPPPSPSPGVGEAAAPCGRLGVNISPSAQGVSSGVANTTGAASLLATHAADTPMHNASPLSAPQCRSGQADSERRQSLPDSAGGAPLPTRSPTLEHTSSGDGLPTPHTNSLLHNDTRRRAVTPAPVTTPVTPVPSAARLRRVRKYFRESLDMAAAARSKRQRRTNSSPGPMARPTKLHANACVRARRLGCCGTGPCDVAHICACAHPSKCALYTCWGRAMVDCSPRWRLVRVCCCIHGTAPQASLRVA